MNEYFTGEVSRFLDVIEAADAAMPADYTNEEFRKNRFNKIGIDNPEQWAQTTAGIDPVCSAVLRSLIVFSHHDNDISWPKERSVRNIRRQLPAILDFVMPRVDRALTPGSVLSNITKVNIDGSLINPGSTKKQSETMSGAVALRTSDDTQIVTLMPPKRDDLPERIGVWVESPRAAKFLRSIPQFDYPHPLGSIGKGIVQVYGDPWVSQKLWQGTLPGRPGFNSRIGKEEVVQRLEDNFFSINENTRTRTMSLPDIAVTGALSEEPWAEDEINKLASAGIDNDPPFIYDARRRALQGVLAHTTEELRASIPAHHPVDKALSEPPVDEYSPYVGYALLLQAFGTRTDEDFEQELTYATRLEQHLLTPYRRRDIANKTELLSSAII